MQGFCITVETANKLKEAAKRKEINITDMYTMTSKQRRSLFEKYVDTNTARQINAAFENAQISNKQGALKKWAEDVFTPKQKQTSPYRDVLKKIDSLNEMGALTPKGEDKFYEDLVATQLGATVSSEEAATIAEKATKLQELAKVETEFGTPTIEYFKAKREMDDYLDSLTPASKLRVTTSITARGSMLLSFKSPLLNIESNTIQAFIEAATRRITTKSRGGLNSDYALRYNKFVVKLFNSTKYDLTRVMTLDSNRKSLGEEIVNAAGPGKTRAIARFYEDIVFGKMLSLPDVIFASFHFSDSANIFSSKLAQSKGLKGEEAKAEALKIFKDATKIQPITPEGKVVRAQAVADAEYATYTNNSVYSNIGLTFRKAVNLASGDYRLGDNLMPFVKTPANVVGAGIEASGILIPIDVATRVVKLIGDIKQGKSFKDASGNNFKGFSRSLVRAGIGLSVAYLLSRLFKPEDFIGEYPISPKERELLKLKNATTNSVKINNKWVSLDYFGALGAPLVGLLYAKKYGTSLPSKIFYYYQGNIVQSSKIPGFRDIAEYYAAISAPIQANTYDKAATEAVNIAIDEVRSRIIPAIINDIAVSTDKVIRETDTGSDPLAKVKASIPGIRQTLPAKKDIFGDEIPTEGWRYLFTGARAKTANETLLVKELTKLEKSGNLPVLSDISKTSTRAAELEKQLGKERYDIAIQEYKTRLKDKLYDYIAPLAYNSLTDTEKMNGMNDIRTKTFEYILKKYNYKKPDK